MNKAIVMLADGVEECEALLVVDILRRAGTEVVTVSINKTTKVISSHQITLYADEIIKETNFEEADILVLPGGLKGTENLSMNQVVLEQCKNFAEKKMLAAICAAPSILASLGLLEGKKATVHPNFEEKMHGAVLTHGHVAVDGNIITGQGLAAGIEFSLELAARLEGKEKSEKVARGICCKI